MTMDLKSLPRFPDGNEELRRQGMKRARPIGDSLYTLFEFGMGFALVNVALGGLVAARFGRDADAFRFCTGSEAVLVFGVFALLILASRLQEDPAWSFGPAHPLGPAVFTATVGGGLVGFGFAWSLWQLLAGVGAVGRPGQGSPDYIVAGLLFGALLGCISGEALSLAGGTPDWGAGPFFTGLAKAIPSLVRKVLFRKRMHELRIPGKPWLEGVLWLGCVADPIAWLLS